MDDSAMELDTSSEQSQPGDLKKAELEESPWVLAAALDGEYISLSNLVAWTDRQVLRLESPPS
jgi:hypothetical protein